MAKDSSHTTREILNKLWEFTRPDRRDISAILGYAALIGLLSVTLPLGVQSFVNNLAFGALLQPVFVVALLVLAALGISSLIRGLQLLTAEYLQRKLFYRISLELAHRLPRIDSEELRGVYGADLVYRYLCLTTVQKGGIYLILEGVDVTLKLVVGCLILAFFHPALLAFDLILVASIYGIFFGLARGAVQSSFKESKAKFQIASWLEEIGRHQLVFRTLSGRDLAFEKADKLTAEYLEARSKSFGFVFRQASSLLALQAIAGAGLLGVGGWLVVRQQLTVGQLVAAELIVSGLVMTLSKFPKHLETFYDLCAALEKLGWLFELPLERSQGIDLAPNGALSLRISDLHFAPDARTPTLSGLSLNLEAGSKAAVLAASGSGKTALCHMVYGLLSPERGSLEMDGMDSRSIRLESLRDQLALVRGVQLIKGSILDNIIFGKNDVSAAEAVRATEVLGLKPAILALESGFETQVSATGLPLTPSQAIMLTVARAIAHRPRLIMIDGTLDTMASGQREAVLQTLQNLPFECTLLIFTQDPSIVARMPIQLAMERGKIQTLDSGERRLRIAA